MVKLFSKKSDPDEKPTVEEKNKALHDAQMTLRMYDRVSGNPVTSSSSFVSKFEPIRYSSPGRTPSPEPVSVTIYQSSNSFFSNLPGRSSALVGALAGVGMTIALGIILDLGWLTLAIAPPVIVMMAMLFEVVSMMAGYCSGEHATSDRTITL